MSRSAYPQPNSIDARVVSRGFAMANLRHVDNPRVVNVMSRFHRCLHCHPHGEYLLYPHLRRMHRLFRRAENEKRRWTESCTTTCVGVGRRRIVGKVGPRVVWNGRTSWSVESNSDTGTTNALHSGVRTTSAYRTAIFMRPNLLLPQVTLHHLHPVSLVSLLHTANRHLFVLRHLSRPLRVKPHPPPPSMEKKLPGIPGTCRLV